MHIPLVDLRAQHARIASDLMAAVSRVVDEQRFILGPEVDGFENELARYLGVRHVVGVASGTDALVLALHSLGIGAGDDVITTAYSFAATAEAIVRVGARPVFCDIDRDSMNLSPASVRQVADTYASKRTRRLRALIVVHLFGLPADMEALSAIAREFNLDVLEDAAQALGARVDGRLVGAMSTAGCFSFFPSKNLGGWGDGGAVATNRDDIASRVRRLRVHGTTTPDHHEEVGYNSRLDALQAAVLRVKLPHVDNWNEERSRVAAWYREALAGVEGVPASPRTGIEHAHHQFVVRVNDRANVQQRLAKEGIASQVYYPQPLPKQRAFVEYDASSVPEAEEASTTALALPMYPELPREHVLRVCEVLRGCRHALVR